MNTNNNNNNNQSKSENINLQFLLNFETEIVRNKLSNPNIKKRVC